MSHTIHLPPHQLLPAPIVTESAQPTLDFLATELEWKSSSILKDSQRKKADMTQWINIVQMP